MLNREHIHQSNLGILRVVYGVSCRGLTAVSDTIAIDAPE